VLKEQRRLYDTIAKEFLGRLECERIWPVKTECDRAKEARRGGRRPKVIREECIALAERGVSVKFLARRYGVSVNRIYQVLREQ